MVEVDNPMSEWTQFIQDLVTKFNQSYGVSSFFSSPNQAASWVQNHVIDPNPRLSSLEKEILTGNSISTRDYANQEVATTTLSSRDGAYLYWGMMRDYIVLNTFDQRLYDLFDVGVDAAESTANPESVVPYSSLTIPWWVWLFGGLFVLNVARK